MAVRFLASLALVAVGACTLSNAQAAVPYGPGALAVVVRDGKGTAVVGALVAVTGPVSRQATTLTGGLVVLQALPVGAYDVTISKAGYATVETSAIVKAATTAPQLLPLRLAPADLTSASATAVTLPATLDPTDDPFASHALAAAPEVDVVANPGGTGSAAALAGSAPFESRAELDGIPLPRDFSGASGLRFRSGLALDAIDVEPGLGSAPLDTALDTIGGTVNYRTPAIATALSAGVVAGYDSTYGSFQRTRFSDTFGRYGVAADLITGGAESRSQTLKAQYAFNSATTLAVASYGSQASAVTDSAVIASVAPATAVDFRTAFGGATLEARGYRSASRTDELVAGDDFSTDDRLSGAQLNLALPLDAALVSLGLDRRWESAFAMGTQLDRTYSTVSARAEVPLGRAYALELADAYGSGTDVRPRHDPQAALTIGKGEPWSLRLAAGSAYATLPLDVAALLPATERDDAPETSFGYRATLRLRLDGRDRVWTTAFRQRRYDALAPLSQATSRGLEFGFERTAAGAGFGALAYLDLQRAYGFGTPQAFAPALAQAFATDAQLPGDAYSKARVAVSYRLSGDFAVRIGTTLLGNGNALGGRALALGDASLVVPLGSLAQARIGIENAFGHPVTNPVLAPEFAPHEITFSIGRR